ncbi:MAG TPA: hypothetical protein VHY20_00540, partial [Pirellulales bacterium]|nr:hypothetical protein [Pirellulales bacterium]
LASRGALRRRRLRGGTFTHCRSRLLLGAEKCSHELVLSHGVPPFDTLFTGQLSQMFAALIFERVSGHESTISAALANADMRLHKWQP